VKKIKVRKTERIERTLRREAEREESTKTENEHASDPIQCQYKF